MSYEVVGYRGKSGKLGTYKKVGEAADKFQAGQKRAHLRSFDGSLDFWVDAAKLEAAPPRSEASKRRSGCSCVEECCDPRCTCPSYCNCRGGNVYDC